MGQAFMTRRGGGGKKLPALTNPAGPEQIMAGYQAISADGVMVNGTLEGYGMVSFTAGDLVRDSSVNFECPGEVVLAGSVGFVSDSFSSMTGSNSTITGMTMVSGVSAVSYYSSGNKFSSISFSGQTVTYKTHTVVYNSMVYAIYKL